MSNENGILEQILSDLQAIRKAVEYTASITGQMAARTPQPSQVQVPGQTVPSTAGPEIPASNEPAPTQVAQSTQLPPKPPPQIAQQPPQTQQQVAQQPPQTQQQVAQQPPQTQQQVAQQPPQTGQEQQQQTAGNLTDEQFAVEMRNKAREAGPGGLNPYLPDILKVYSPTSGSIHDIQPQYRAGFLAELDKVIAAIRAQQG